MTKLASPDIAGLAFDTVEDWMQLCQAAGLADAEADNGPFEMMTARGFLADEGVGRSVAIMARVAARPAHMREMAWLMPHVATAGRYLGYIVVAATKPG